MFILFFYKLCNSYLNCILWAYVLMMYIFTNVSQTCLDNFLSWICIIIESNTFIENQYKILLTFSYEVLWTWICYRVGFFWEKRFFLINSYELLVVFPHQKIHNLKFFSIFLFNFSIAILKKLFTPSAERLDVAEDEDLEVDQGKQRHWKD